MKTWIGFALLSMLFAGITSVLAKFGLKNVSGDAGLAIRTSAVFAFVWLNTLAFGYVREIPRLSKQDLLFLCLSALTTTLSWIFYYRAMKAGEVSVVAGIDKASIVVTLLLSWWLLREPMTPKVVIGAALVLAGMLVLAWK